jgi:hypothetical protein
MQHTMLVYSSCVFENYLDKSPKYSFPDVLQHALGDVDDSKPSIYEVQIHHHGKESAVVMEGSNLWFCYQLSFRGLKLPVPASDISGSSIQFNGVKVPTESTAAISSGKEIVNLLSHFKSKVIHQEVEVHERVRCPCMVVTYRIAGNFRGVQFSWMASLHCLIFADSRLSTKTVKIGPLKSVPLCGTSLMHLWLSTVSMHVQYLTTPES